MNMETMFVTVTGVSHYYDLTPFRPGCIVKLVKDKHNNFDDEAIAVRMPFIDTVGYVANSVNTVFLGTFSAGRLYDRIGDFAYARIMFVTHSSVIALVLPPEANASCKEVFEKDDVEKQMIY